LDSLIDPTEQCEGDLCDDSIKHYAPGVVVEAGAGAAGAALASFAMIRPTPAMTAAMADAKSAAVAGSPSNIAVRTLPTATRMAPTPAIVVFLFSIYSYSFKVFILEWLFRVKAILIDV
jgi:hypothetical protein